MVIVDPIREFSPQDDGWAYAHSVQWLLQHGTYRLDTWSAANMPVQIYLAAGLATVFGYSLSLLSASTLCMLLVAMLSFFALLRELRVEVRPAFALTLALLANPLVLMLAFSFMSDIQFLGWLCLALWLYARGLRRANGLDLLAGAAAAACAIGTRQFGMAIIPAMAVAALSMPRPSRPSLAMFSVALALPIAMSGWQLGVGLQAPNPTQAVRLAAQSWYLAHSWSALLQEAAWRTATICRYLGIATLAATPLFVPLALRELRASRRMRWATASAALFLLGFAGVGSSITARETAHGAVLPLWWLLPNAFWRHPRLMAVFDGLGLGASILLLALVVAGAGRWRHLRDSPATLMTVIAGVALLALHLVYVQLNDTYIVGLLPFALIWVALCARAPAARPRLAAASASLSLVMIVGLSFWVRGQYNLQETQWRAAEGLLAANVQPRCIGGLRHWSEYHGAFDDWLAAGRPDERDAAAKSAESDEFHAPFYDWLLERTHRASFLISTPNEPVPPGWKPRQALGFRDWLDRPLTISVYERVERLPESGGAVDGHDQRCAP